MVVALALALVMGAAGCVRKASPPITAASGPQVSSRAGMSAGAQVLWESDAQQDADFAAIANAGARWLALDVDWNSIQGDGPLSFRWDRAMDRAVCGPAAHGLTILGIAAYSPPWARPANCPSGTTHCLPADPNAFGRFMAAAAQRYGSNSSIAALRGSITSWQIWNEPNHQEFAQPKPSPSQYTAMLKSAYVSIKSVDPTATVVTGGTAPAPDAADGTEYTPETWLRALYSNGARGFFDAVGHHPYAFPVNPLEPHPWNAYTQVAVLHVVMTAAGDGNKKIWGTEMGGSHRHRRRHPQRGATVPVGARLLPRLEHDLRRVHRPADLDGDP